MAGHLALRLWGSTCTLLLARVHRADLLLLISTMGSSHPDSGPSECGLEFISFLEKREKIYKMQRSHIIHYQ